MTLALFFLGWFAISLLLGAAWAATASTRRCGMDTLYPLVSDRADEPAQTTRQPDQARKQPVRVGGASTYSSDSIAS
jgi:hypothetical protein